MNILEVPWRQPDYKGKLKPTPILPCQPGFVEPQGDCKEIIYTALADGDIDLDLFNKMILRCK